MKVPFMIILMILVYPFTTFAQNNVTVSQNGNGNSVSINHGLEKESNVTDCSKATIDSKGNNNTIKVSKAGDKQQPGLLQSNIQRNNLSSFLFDLYMLEALQQGDANSIFIILPDSGTVPQTITATQQGRTNTFSARLTPETSDVSVSQSGEGNSVEINPCESNKQ